MPHARTYLVVVVEQSPGHAELTVALSGRQDEVELGGHKEDSQHQVGQRDVDDEQVLGLPPQRGLGEEEDDEGQVAGQDPDGQR